jgi:hypothetical protein
MPRVSRRIIILLSLSLSLLEETCPFQLERIHDANHRWSDPSSSSSPSCPSRAKFIESVAAAATAAAAGLITGITGNAKSSLAFEGGVGGLGKTKPETGVVFLEGSEPLQNSAGIVSAELLLVPDSGRSSERPRPVRVEFSAPWPLLSGSAGLEARDLQTSESAFVQVVNGVSALPPSNAAAKELLLKTVFSSQGKFSAYGSPMDVKVRKIETGGGVNDDDNDAVAAVTSPALYSVSFTTFTPGLRESERQAAIGCRLVGTSLVMLVAGTTAQRFRSQQELMERVASSLQAFEAPELRR